MTEQDTAAGDLGAEAGCVVGPTSAHPARSCPAGCPDPNCLGPGGLRYDPAVLGPWLTGPVKPTRKPINGRDKGLQAERDLANWCVRMGWPDARRSVSTGWVSKGRKHQDQGDIAGVPRLCFQLKNLATDLVPGVALDRVWREVRAQAGPDRMPLLVEKRTGKANPGEWFLWIRLADLAELTTGMPASLMVRANNLVRTTLGYHADDLLDYSRNEDA